MNNEISWYYIDDTSTKHGPISSDEICNLITSGTIKRDTLLWNKEMKEWEKASKTEFSEQLSSIAPSIPMSKLSAKWVWTLATVPLLVSIVCGLLGIYGTMASVVVIILNIVFICLDTDYLKKSGISVDGWMWFGILLVPVYLFVRAQKTDKNWAYGITWCVIFILSFIL